MIGAFAPAEIAGLVVAATGVLALLAVVRRARAARPFLPPIPVSFRPETRRLSLLLALDVFLLQGAGGFLVKDWGDLGDALGIAIPLAAAPLAFALARPMTPRGSAPWRIGMGLLHLWAALPLVYGTFLLVRLLGFPEQNQVVDLKKRAEGWEALAIFAAIVAPVAEEVAFRGLLYPALRVRLPARLAIVFTSLAFAAVHEPTVWLPMAILGACFAWVTERTGSVLPSMAAHVAFNSFNVVMMLLL